MVNKFVAFAAVVALVLSVIGYFRPVTPVQLNVPQVGGASGYEHTNQENFYGGAYLAKVSDLNGALPSVSTSTNGTLSAKRACEEGVFDVLALTTTNSNIVFPSSTSMFNQCLQQVGDVRSFWVQNNSATTTFTLAVSDQSSTLKTIVAAATSTVSAATSSLNFGNVAKVSAIRTASSTSVWLNWVVEVFK